MAIPSDQATHLDVTAPPNVEAANANTELTEKEVLSQDITPESEPLPVVSGDSACEAEKSGEVQELDCIKESTDIEKTALSSPFPSPKAVADDCEGIVSLERGEILEEKPCKSVVASPVLAKGQEEQSHEKAELKLGTSHSHHARHELTWREASLTAKKEFLASSIPEIQAKIAGVDTEIEDSDSKTDTDMTIETPKSFKPAVSLPPHMRPDFQSPPSRHFGLQDSRHMIPPKEVARSNEGLRAPRAQYTSYQPRGDHMDREQFARMSAQLMKTKHELDTERNKNRRLRITIEAEQQQKVEAASSSMLTNLLRDQAEALTLKAKVEARERELDLREQKISQHEVYLSEGQKQLWFSLEENGVRPMSAVQIELARREVELNAQKAIADVNGKLNIKIEGLRLREAAQQMREQQYKTMIRESLKDELSDSLSSEKADEIAEIEYNNGFGAGKEAGRKEAHKKSHQRGFLEGYGACHRTQVTLSKVRQGLISPDSPDLDFLYDANHSHNLWNIGELVGRLQHDDKVSQMTNAVKKETVTERKALSHSRNHEAYEEVPPMDGRVNGDANGTMVHKREEPIRKMPPARPTFATELRGPSATHNGHIILANNAASPAAKETERPVIKYENDVVNLIDFM